MTNKTLLQELSDASDYFDRLSKLLILPADNGDGTCTIRCLLPKLGDKFTISGFNDYPDGEYTVTQVHNG